MLFIIVVQLNDKLYQIIDSATDKATARQIAIDAARNNPGLDVVITREVARGSASISDPIIVIP
jgi:hypothetical protein